MLREPCSWLKPDSSDPFYGVLPDSLSSNFRGTSLLSQPSCVPSGESRKENAPNADGVPDHAIVTMQTRVAIRDENPHRFQVVPLREVSKLETSSAAHCENVSRPTISAPPRHKTILQPRPKLRVDYKPRSQPSIYPTKSSLELCVKQTIASCDGPLDTDKEDPCVMPAAIVPPDSERCEIPLAQLDVNQPERRTSATSSRADASSTVSIQKLVHSEFPPTCTISRSLQIRTRSERNYHRSVSTGHVHPPVMPLLVGTPKPKARSRTLSDATLLNCRIEDLDADDESYYALLDAYDSNATEARLKKRHAIYSSTFYFNQPNLKAGSESSSNSQKITYANMQALSGSSAVAKSNADVGRLNPDSGLCRTSSDITSSHHRTHSMSTNSEYPVTGSMDLLPTSLHVTQNLSHKSSSHSLHIHKLSGGLKRSKLTREQPLVYPQVILDLLSDTDKAIVEWKYI